MNHRKTALHPTPDGTSDSHDAQSARAEESSRASTLPTRPAHRRVILLMPQPEATPTRPSLEAWVPATPTATIGDLSVPNTVKQQSMLSRLRASVLKGISRSLRSPGVRLGLMSFWLTLMWVAAIRPMDAPDEPAHIQAVMQVRNKLILPEIHYDFSQTPAQPIGTPGDVAIQNYALQVGINDPYKLIPYESMQPPLYYLLTGIISELVPRNPQTIMYVARLVAAFFGAVTVYFCWAAARQFAPQAPLWAVAAAGSVALLPQFCFNSATAANDSIANAACAAAFYIWFRGLRDKEYDPRMLRGGAILGLAILAKLTAAALIPGLALVILFRAFQADRTGRSWREWRKVLSGIAPSPAQPLGLVSTSTARLTLNSRRVVRVWLWIRESKLLRRGLRMGIGTTVGMLVVCGWWLIRNLIVYGEVSGSRDALLFYSLRFFKIDLNSAESLNWFKEWSWQSTWGFFGWLNHDLPHELYEQARWVTGAMLVFSALALLLLVGRMLFLRRRVVPIYAWQATVVMVAVIAVLYVGYIQFSVTVAAQPQARYFYPVLLAAGLLFTGGLYALAPGRVLKVLLLGGLLVWLAIMNAVGIGVVR